MGLNGSRRIRTSARAYYMYYILIMCKHEGIQYKPMVELDYCNAADAGDTALLCNHGSRRIGQTRQETEQFYLQLCKRLRSAYYIQKLMHFYQNCSIVESIVHVQKQTKFPSDNAEIVVLCVIFVALHLWCERVVSCQDD